MQYGSAKRPCGLSCAVILLCDPNRRAAQACSFSHFVGPNAHVTSQSEHYKLRPAMRRAKGPAQHVVRRTVGRGGCVDLVKSRLALRLAK
ncbi:MAG TPA: hypothetical protein VGJ00_05040 [Rhabdochlamydiaceae bacterium]